MKTGQVQVYTGNGKGKTTAALGLCVRALGAGLSVYIGQFIKGMRYAEIVTLEQLSALLGKDRLEVEQYGRGCFIFRDPAPEDVEAAARGLDRAVEILRSGTRELVVLDEINVACHYGLVPEERLPELLDARPEGVELVLTGRYAPDLLLQRGDLVTEMKEIKHYYHKGLQARDGIER